MAFAQAFKSKTALPKELFLRSTLENLSVYGAAHFLVDLICAGALFSLFAGGHELIEIAFLVVLYNILAFGLQLPLGIISDILRKPRFFGALGLLIAAGGGIIAFYSPLYGIIAAGIGNALFHIGGGSISLNLTPKKASAPGIFVAPGALGLLAGTLIGKFGLFNPFIFGGLALLLTGGIIMLKQIKMNYSKKPAAKINYFELIVIFLLIVIVSRSVLGFAISFPWKVDLLLLVVLTIGVVLGKAFGGILGDKFGWIKAGAGGLIVSAPLIFLGVQNPLLGILGLFLFNFTMPITLTALSNIFPGKPGFSFGLTCMALLIGALPVLVGLNGVFSNLTLVACGIVVTAIILFISLYLLRKPFEKSRFNKKKNIVE